MGGKITTLVTALAVVTILTITHTYFKRNSLQILVNLSAFSRNINEELSAEMCEAVGEFPGTVILGRPTGNEITFNLLAEYDILKVRIDAEPVGQVASASLSAVFSMKADQSIIVTLTGLKPNSRYLYTIVRETSDGLVVCSPTHGFQTQRALGTPFKFSIIADSHLGTQHHCNVLRYQQTLSNVHYTQPDFVLSIGDDFRASMLKEPAVLGDVEKLYRNQRPYFLKFAQDSPLFNVVGNHEMQSGWLLDGTDSNVAVWAVKSRLAHFPNPRPNYFYSGGAKTENFIPYGLAENYYAWTWGDALFVTLDNYLYSRDELGWPVSLGYDQYNWLRDVLRVDSSFKFLFHHHLCGSARGAIEWADYYEWGGNTPLQGKSGKGLVWEFDSMRPGWGNQSIHQILVENGVDIVFQGHDHLYAMQEHPDGIVYVTAPMPGFDQDNFWGGPNDNSMSYKSGVVMSPSGHISVDVNEDTATISYILSRIPGDDPQTGVNGQIAHAFSLIR